MEPDFQQQGVALMDPMMGPAPFDPADHEQEARDLHDAYTRARDAKRFRDLTAEKYLLHIDGEGDGQWMDILFGSRIGLVGPPDGLRLQQNLLRPLVDQWVAYHTSQKFQVAAKARGDRESRDRARLDTIFANDLIEKQRINQVFREALNLAAAYGSCPIHVMWRQDTEKDDFQPTYSQDQAGKGYPDVFCGDPWGMIYNPGANVSSLQWAMYDRVLPLQNVKDAFAAVPGIEDLKGSKDLPSASRMQRILYKWGGIGTNVHGTAGIQRNEGSGELVSLICKETAPGVDREHPRGRLQIMAISGSADADPELSQTGRPIMLHDGPLPGGRFSFVRLFSGFRADDEYGKPYVADLDDLQIQLNQLVTHQVEYLRRFARPPFQALAGSLIDDTVTTEDDGIIELTQDANGFQPGFLFPPAHGVGVYDNAIERIQQQMFRIGGWQAASRGESKSGDPAAKVAALQKADDTIFGPVGSNLQECLIELLGTAHALFREYADGAWLVENVTGDDLGYLASPYIEAQQLSANAPRYQVTSSYGSSPDAVTQELIQLIQTTDAQGTPLLTAKDFWKLNPDTRFRPHEISADAMRTARATRINYEIQDFVRQVRAQLGDQADLHTPALHQQLSMQLPLNRDDPPQLHIETLAQLTQDMDEDILVQRLAQLRQDLYYEWMAAQQAQMQAAQMAAQPEQQQQEPEPRRIGRGARPVGAGDSPRSRQMARDMGSVGALTQQAKAGNA